MVAEGDPESAMVWHWPVLKELMELAKEAQEVNIDIGNVAAGVRGWETLTLSDQEDVLGGIPRFLMDAKGFRYRSRNFQSIGPMSGVYFWLFVAPKSRKRIEEEFTAFAGRLREAIREAEAG